jgi:hypothetical protein
LQSDLGSIETDFNCYQDNTGQVPGALNFVGARSAASPP